MKSRVRIIGMALFFLFPQFIAIIGCADKKKPDRQAQIKTMLQGFFNVPTIPGQMSGLWTGDQASVSKMVESKYLSTYVAKPDEKQAAEIRERLKSLKMYFRVQGNTVHMLTIVADSLGTNIGKLTLRQKSEPGLQVYDAVMRGKGAPLNAIFRYRRTAKPEKLEYEEASAVLTAYREAESAESLVNRYFQQINEATGLTQY